MNDTSNDSEYNQRAMRAIVLCVLVAIVYTQFFLAPKRQVQQQQLAQQQQQQQTQTTLPVGSQAASPQPMVVSPAPGATAPSVAMRPTVAELQAAPHSVINAGRTTVSLVHLGARIEQYGLRDYKRDLNGDEALNLVDSSTTGALPLGLYIGQESDERVMYTLTSLNGAPVTSPTANLNLEPNSRVVLEFRGALPSGRQITKKITLEGDSFLIGVDVALDRPIESGQSVWLEWTHYYSSAIEKELRIKHSLTLLDGANKIQLVPIEQMLQGLQDRGVNRWVALGDTYFAMALVPTVTTRNTIIGREGDVFLTRVAGTQSGGQFYAYAGPKDYKMLEAIGDFSLERTIDLGWFSFLALPLLWLLRFLYSLVGNYGVAIIALTLIVKAVMLPLSKASFVSAKKMQDLQPEIKALRERVKDPNQLNQEMFALYKRKGVNPMGGCFPVLIQIPVFLGLYNALLNAIELRHAPFAGWITDLSAPESLQILGIGVPVMVLLMAASMVYQTWTTPTPSADPAQQKMMMIMPLVFAGMFIIFPMPAGLVLYWLVNNIISIIQQLYMRNAERGSVYVGTAVASVVIFGIGYLLTMI
ncbi:MAG: membrane protein insertase YidC [Pseudomonadota bacterium]